MGYPLLFFLTPFLCARSIGKGTAIKSIPTARWCETEDLTMLRSLFLQAPSFDGFDGAAGARYQMKREVRSFWYPTWLAQPAALVEGSKLIDATPQRLKIERLTHELMNTT